MHVCLLGKRTCAEFKHRKPASDATTENETETMVQRQRTLTDEAARRRRLLVCRNANNAAANGMNLFLHGAVGPQTRLNYATSLDRRRNRCHNVHLDVRVHERTSGKLRRTVAQCLDGQVPNVRQAWCPQVAENLEKPPGLAVSLTRTLEETLGACSVVRNRVQIGGTKPAFCGTDAGAPPMHGQESSSEKDSATWCLHFAGPCRTSQAPWHANRSPSGWPQEAKARKNPLWFFTCPTFCRLSQKATTDLTLPPVVPYRWRRSGPSIDMADGSRSLEQVKKRGRFQVRKNSTIRESLPLRAKSGTPARKSPIASPALRRTARAVLRDVPHTAHLELGGLHSGTRQVCNELGKHGITARMWT